MTQAVTKQMSSAHKGKLRKRVLFEKRISLEFYDGAVTGVAEVSGLPERWFAYKLAALDRSENHRVLVLAPLKERLFHQIVECLSVPEPPKWPFWAPLAAPEKAWHRAAQLSNKSERAKYAVLSSAYLDRVFAVCKLTASLQRKLPKLLPAYQKTSYPTWRKAILLGNLLPHLKRFV